MSVAHVTIIATSLLFLAGCGPLVETTLVKRTSSPDSRRDAIVFTKDVGATADTAYHVAVVNWGGGIPSGDGRTVLIADHVEFDGNIDVKWRGNTLNIYIPRTARTFRSLATVRIDGLETLVRVVAR